MSIRTIIVGILAAFCGICATVGFMTLQSNQAAQSQTKQTLLVAKTDISLGQQIEGNLIETIEWKSDKVPPGAYTSKTDVIDKYCTGTLVAGEVLTSARFADSPTTLMPANGLRAYAIEALSASTNVGANLMTGNRVDIIWQTSGKLKEGLDPISVRLIQNVKILAVGQVDSDKANDQKSITLEVKPKMDENLAFAQAYGKLTLSLRNPSDNDGVEPTENVKFKDLLADLETAKAAPVPPTAWDKFSDMIGERVAKIEKKMLEPQRSLSEPESAVPERVTLNRITTGMRAITIQTPDESVGMAGLLEPGDRVDLHLTVETKLSPIGNARTEFPSEKLIENIEILAVDSKVFSVNDDGEKEMGKSVTLIVLESMIKDIKKASQLGTLSLTLIGFDDSENSPPRMVVSTDDFIAKHLPIPFAPIQVDNTANNIVSTPVKIRTLRGQAAQEMPFSTQ